MVELSVAIRLRGLTRTFGDVVAVNGVDLDVIDPSHCRCTLSKPAVVDCGLFRRAVHASSCLLSCLWPTSLLLPLLFPALLISILRGLARSASGIVNLSTPAS